MSIPFPRLRPFGLGTVRAQTASEASAFDARAIESAGVPQPVLMENAGRSAAAVLVRHFGAGPDTRVCGLVGSGNNGGDALVLLRTLTAWGIPARAILVGDRPGEDPLLHGWPLEVARDDVLDDAGWGEWLVGADLIVDGLLGTGVQGAPRTRQASAIDRANASGVPIMALDVPSGIDASTGLVPGRAIKAALTVAFGAPKTGALVRPARALVGRHVVVEIGFPPMEDDDASALVVTPSWARRRIPVRSTDTHKNQVGRVAVVGGQAGMAGAVILAAHAALRTGAGFVRVCSREANRPAVQAAVPEATFVSLEDPETVDAALANSDAVALGPGLGTDELARRVLRRVASVAGPALVCDADALNLAGEGVVALAEIAEKRPLLLTPHPGELSRLLGDGPDAGAGVILRARAAVDRFGAAVLLKGAPSLVAPPGGRPVMIDSQGSSDLASAGMGDTLSGVCAALMAAGLEPATAGAVGLYLAGRAAVIAGRGPGLTPSDVLRWLPDALREPGGEQSELDLPFVIFDADPAR
jgi:NAD(P)H-hydrate epimerase